MSTKNFRLTSWQLAGLLCTSLLPGNATAGIELYKTDNSKLDFNASFAGAFFQNSSWFGESEEFLGGDTDSWGEFGAELGLAWEYTSGKSTVFAELSGVYTSTGSEDASGLTIGLDKTNEATLEQAHLGWRYDDPLSGLEEDSFSLTVGRQDYLIGTGLLIADGGSDGGELGGWYLGLRKSFQESVIASLKSKTLKAEGFFIQNRPRRGGTQGEALGGNFEYTLAESLTAAATYMVVDPKLDATSNLDVWSWRLGWKGLGGLELNGEYVIEDSDQYDADGWYGQAAWAFSDTSWSPWIAYRYAVFSGDDPNTAKNETFSSIAYGYTDYGSWFQGEISGNYPLGNGNLGSNQFRVKAQPNEAWTLNLIYYNFKLEEPGTLSPDVTSDDWGDEVNFTADYAATDNWYLVGVLAVLFPGDAAVQWTGGNDDWWYGMLFASYTF
jgi:hypothetical protein